MESVSFKNKPYTKLFEYKVYFVDGMPEMFWKMNITVQNWFKVIFVGTGE